MSLLGEASMPASPTNPVVLVGVCAAGKTTVSHILEERGIVAKAVAQEHSQVPELYRRTGSTVVMLCASWRTVHQRRALSWDPAFYRTEWDRLRDARHHAGLIVHTDSLNPEQVADVIEDWLHRQRIPVH
ncbi:hypothetical protein [Sulfobacillus harzensis]|uniref:AAA domain-containing protein n=1 Tax=Sulfobacillus harzensis TaxID=2729629 RepID=A0A7Y0L399_9FIRM|nr:hypothetical protein [Sulfobacillus harzensis]NMP22514.1 hypothetical protein [Sulfobacillus harzensis]